MGAVAGDGEGALCAGLDGGIALADILLVLGAGVHGSGVLGDALLADDVVVHILLGVRSLERQHEVVRHFQAGIVRTGGDAGHHFFNGHVVAPFG